MDPLTQQLMQRAWNAEKLRHFTDPVAALGDLLDRFDLEFFRVASPAHIHTFWFALV